CRRLFGGGHLVFRVGRIFTMGIDRLFELEQSVRFSSRHRPIRLDYQIGELKESMTRPVCVIEPIPAVIFFEIRDDHRRAVEALRNIFVERRGGQRKGVLFRLEIEPATNGFKITLLLLDWAVADVYELFGDRNQLIIEHHFTVRWTVCAAPTFRMLMSSGTRKSAKAFLSDSIRRGLFGAKDTGSGSNLSRWVEFREAIITPQPLLPFAFPFHVNRVVQSVPG